MQSRVKQLFPFKKQRMDMSCDTPPNYIKGASFIKEDEDVDENWWPRDPFRYDPTRKWKKRMRRLSGIIETQDVREAIQQGDIYRAAKGNVAFTYDLEGLAIYVVMDAQLEKEGDEYPTDPDKSDYWFKGVTVWPYIYDRELAWSTGRWTGKQLDVVEQIRKENLDTYK